MEHTKGEGDLCSTVPSCFFLTSDSLLMLWLHSDYGSEYLYTIKYRHFSSLIVPLANMTKSGCIREYWSIMCGAKKKTRSIAHTALRVSVKWERARENVRARTSAIKRMIVPLEYSCEWEREGSRWSAIRKQHDEPDWRCCQIFIRAYTLFAMISWACIIHTYIHTYILYSLARKSEAVK